MSLFKTREWWSTLVGEGEEFDAGCLCIADIENKGTDKIIVGSYHGIIRIYQPRCSRAENQSGSDNPNDVICEVQLSLPIIQLEAGRFVSSSDTIHLGVLHPRKFTVYSLSAQPGITEHGKQYQLNRIYEHKLQRTSYNFCYGPFGGAKGRDFFCVQSMDGAVSVFEQESFAFCRFLPAALLPGPIKYVGHTDSFITVSSSQQVECYKFQVLATATDDKSKQESQNITTGKRVTADWTFLLNETALDLVVSAVAHFSVTIFVLGERNLYILTDGGQLINMLKFDFSPSCFLPYHAGGTDAVSVMIGTHAKTLLVYQNTSLKWAAQMSIVPVQVKVVNFSDARGMIVAIDEEGHLQCFYLGTDPSMFTRPTSDFREIDYPSAEKEMQKLQLAIKEHQHKSVLPSPSSSNAQDDLKLTLFVPSSLDQPSLAHESEIDDSVPVPSITVTVTLQAKTLLQDVKLSVHVARPLVVSEPFLTVSSVEPGRPVEKQMTVYMKHRMLPSDLRIEATATYYTGGGAPRVMYSSGRLPMSLVMKPSLPVKNAACKLTIDTNKPPVSLTDIFPELIGSGTENASNAFGFKYYGLDPVITVLASKNSQRYRVQCDEFSCMWHPLNEFVGRLSSHFKMGRNSDFAVSYEGPLPLQEYFEVIDKHFESRKKQIELAKILEEHASQFRAVQKRLLTLYKDKTPAPLSGLDVLLERSYTEVMSLASVVDENNLKLDVTSAELSAATRMICLLTKLCSSGMSAEDCSVLESCLTPIIINSSVQGWEEIVDASVTHLFRAVLSKNSKEILVNPGPLTPHQDTEKVKKHISILCDRLSKGARLSEGSPKGQDKPSGKNQVSLSHSRQDIAEDSTYTHQVTKNKKKAKAANPSLEDDSLFDIDNKKHQPHASGDSYSVPKDDDDDLPELHSGSRFVKKSTSQDRYESSNDRVPDLDDLSKDDDLLKTGQDELVYGL